MSPDIGIGLESAIAFFASDRLRVDLMGQPVLFAPVLTGLATSGEAFPGERKKRVLRVVELHREVLE